MENASKIVPKNSKVLNNLGLIYLVIEELAAERGYFQKAVANRPNYVEAINNLGLSYHALGEAEVALVMFDKAIDIKSDYLQALVSEANTLR